jgi:2-hydroxychromene-2-carboxylate isomerase
MPDPVVAFYFDVRSPYSYLAWEPVLTLPQHYAVSVEALPYTVALADAFGTPETRDAREVRKIKYTYMDVRRFANERGLTIRGTVKIWDTRIAHAAYLYARQFGRERALYEHLLPKFWNREFDIENVDKFAALLGEVGARPDGFRAYLDGTADAELAAIVRDADGKGMFGVPTCIFEDELFWGADRVEVLKRRLVSRGLAKRSATS